jgi:hypothetical protein
MYVPNFIFSDIVNIKYYDCKLLLPLIMQHIKCLKANTDVDQYSRLLATTAMVALVTEEVVM